MNSTTTLIIAMLLLSGCSVVPDPKYPIPLVRPTFDKDSSVKYTETESQKRLVTEKVTQDAKTVDEVKSNMKIYGDSYEFASANLMRSEYRSKHVTLAGALLAAAGGIAGSVGTATAGAVIGAGSSIFSKYFQFAVQSTNYQKASRAMFCMRSELLFVDEVDGNVRSKAAILFSKANVESFNNEIGPVPIENRAFEKFIVHANENIDRVNRGLFDLQKSVTFSNPDISGLEAAITEAQKIKDQQVGKDEALTEAASNLALREASNLALIIAKKEDEMIPLNFNEYRAARAEVTKLNYEGIVAELDKCVTAFSK